MEKKKIYFSRSAKRTIEVADRIDVLRGVRFSVSLKDEIVLSDILNFELKNPVIREKLEKMAKFFDLSLQGKKRGRYNEPYYAEKKIRKMMLSKSSGVKAVADMARDAQKLLLPHHYYFLLSNGWIQKRELFSGIVSVILDKKKSEFETSINRSMMLIKLAQFDHPSDFRLRTIAKSSKDRDVIVFEVTIPELAEKEAINE